MSELVRLRGKIYFTKYTLCSVGVSDKRVDDGWNEFRGKKAFPIQ